MRRRPAGWAALAAILVAATTHAAWAADPAAPQTGASAAARDAALPNAPGRNAQKLEADLRYQADALERTLQQSARLIRDPAITAYVRSLGCIAAGAQCSEVRFYVVREPQFNAAMFPNGMAIVNTGLMLRVDSEAELAFILGHEFTHYRNRHSLKEVARIKNGLVVANIFSIALAAGGAGSLSSTPYLSVASDAAAFSQDMEREADLAALSALKSAGLDATAAITSFVNMNAEDLASSDPRRVKSAKRAPLFASHPLTEERIAYLKASVAAQGASGTGGADKSAYRARLRPVLADWLNDEMALRDAGAMLNLLDRLAKLGEDAGVIAYYRGEAYRSRNDAGDLDRAIAQFAEAVTKPDAPPAAWRQLGAAQLKRGGAGEARAAFTRYLEIVPNAPDAALITHMLAGLPAAAVAAAPVASAALASPAASSPATAASATAPTPAGPSVAPTQEPRP